MENVADAVKMAGSILLFVIALSVAVFSFSQARETISTVLKLSDRETLTIQGDERYYYLTGDTNRYVGLETILPSIYRAYKENFKIVFDFPDTDYYIYEDKAGNKVTKIDLSMQAIGSDLQSRQFLNGIVYRDFEYETGKLQNDFETKFQIKVNSTSLYSYIISKLENYDIKEHLGTYYTNDLKNENDSSEEGTASNVHDINKTEKRVITYEFIAK